MNRFYWHEALSELRSTYDHRESLPEVEYVSEYGWFRSCTQEKWKQWVSGAKEVPGLLWHIRAVRRLQDKLEEVSRGIESAKGNLEFFLKNYASELEVSISNKIETQVQP